MHHKQFQSVLLSRQSENNGFSAAFDADLATMIAAQRPALHCSQAHRQQTTTTLSVIALTSP